MNKKSNSYKNPFLGDDRLSNPNIQTALPTVDSNRGGEAMSQFFFASELDGTPISRCEPNKKDVEKKVVSVSPNPIRVNTENNDSAIILSKVWPDWRLEQKIGSGAYGVVYKAKRVDHKVESHAAIKIVSIPNNESEMDSLKSEGLDIEARRKYFQEIVDDFVSEIQLMLSLDGSPSIVDVKDYKVIEKESGLGWYICIRMELLTPFDAYMRNKKLGEKEVIKLGCDICKALEVCAAQKIIHRDIKPGNILVHKTGAFKLGDFGIAKKLGSMTGALSQRGTRNYMAPEIINSPDYDSRVDIYSLGLVLYRLLNGNRLPFVSEEQSHSPNELVSAVDRRMRGEVIPAPCEASPAMSMVILRACSYDPAMRFQTAKEMRAALLNILNGAYQPINAEELDKTTYVRRAPGRPNRS